MSLSSSWCERDNRYEHLFHGDAAVLECVLVVAHVVIIVVGVGKEGVAGGKHVARAQVERGPWLAP